MSDPQAMFSERAAEVCTKASDRKQSNQICSILMQTLFNIFLFGKNFESRLDLTVVVVNVVVAVDVVDAIFL